MHGVLGKVRVVSTEIDGHETTDPDRFARPPIRINGHRISFRELALFAWPRKAEANLSYLTGYDARTCRRWLAGQNEPPAAALGIVLAEIMRCYGLNS